MFFKPSFVAAFLAAVATAAPAPGYTLHEKRDVPLTQWVKLDPINREAVLPMRIGMTQSNLAHGQAMLEDM